MNGNRLTHQDVERLLTDPSIENRAVAAAKIADDFSDGAFGDHVRGLALQIFEIMVEEAASRVRVALAEHLKECRDISHDLALRLAQDEDAVAGPILRYSELLTDDDLIAIIRSSGNAKHFAIADRAHLSETVTDGLLEHGTPTVVSRVMANTGARVSPTTLERVMDIYGNDDSVTGAIARRGLLPVSVAERLVTLATESLEKQLSDQSDVSGDAIIDLVMGVRERATLSLVDPRFGIGDACKLVETLAERGRLTPSIILRGLCMGDIAFFEAAMAHLTGLPQLNAQILVHDEGRRGFSGPVAEVAAAAVLLSRCPCRHRGW